MLPLFKINLLPYREALLAKQKKQFQTLMLAAALVGVGLSILVYLGIQSIIMRQESRNQILKEGITESEAQISKIKELNSERANFLARKQKVEELSNKRFEAARIIDTLNTLVPDGLYLTSIESQSDKKDTYIINGRAISDSKTAIFMNALPGNMFTTPELLNIKRGNDAQEFSLRISLNDKQQDQTDNASSSDQPTDPDNQQQSNDASQASN